MKRFPLLSIGLLLAVFTACEERTSILSPDGGPNLASVHLKGGRNAEPSFFDGGLYLSSSSELSGLSNQDVFIGITATANATAICRNPGNGDHQPPGQNPAPVSVSGGVSIPAEEIKNGNLAFTVATEIPSADVVGPRPATTDECPNTSWEWEVTDLSFTSAIITVYQPSPGDPANPRPTGLTVSCTFTPATSNGAVAATTVTCSQS